MCDADPVYFLVLDWWGNLEDMGCNSLEDLCIVQRFALEIWMKSFPLQPCNYHLKSYKIGFYNHNSHAAMPAKSRHPIFKVSFPPPFQIMYALQQNSRPIPHCAALTQAEDLALQYDNKIKGLRNEQNSRTVTKKRTVTTERTAAVSCELTPVTETVAQLPASAAQGLAAVQGVSEETVVAERRPQVRIWGFE